MTCLRDCKQHLEEEAPEFLPPPEGSPWTLDLTTPLSELKSLRMMASGYLFPRSAERRVKCGFQRDHLVVVLVSSILWNFPFAKICPLGVVS